MASIKMQNMHVALEGLENRDSLDGILVQGVNYKSPLRIAQKCSKNMKILRNRRRNVHNCFSKLSGAILRFSTPLTEAPENDDIFHGNSIQTP